MVNACFLDFDGVVIVNGVFSKAAVFNLNSLLEKEPELKIVISSSWRHKGLEFCKILLEENGIDSDKVIGMTDAKLSEEGRGGHIERYLYSHDVDKFVILDDQGPKDMDNISSYLVKTNPFVGLTASDVAKAIKILK